MSVSTVCTIITPPGVVAAAHVRHPLHCYDYKLYSLVVCFSFPVPDLACITVDGQPCHRFISRVMPDVIDANGQAVALHSEIGRNSTVRIGYIRRDSVPVLRVVQIIDLHIANPFAGIES
jgi:hypothetical protein